MTSARHDGPPRPKMGDAAWLDGLLRAQELGGVFPVELRLGDGLFRATDAMRRLLGIGPVDAGSLDAFLDRVLGNGRGQINGLLARSGPGPVPVECDVQLALADGTTRWFLLRGVTEGASGLAGVLIDISQRKKAEELPLRHEGGMHTHNVNFAAIADAMPQMVWSTRPDGFHDYYNAGWYDFTGVPAGSTDGEGWNGMFHPEDQARAWARWTHSLTTGEPYQIEYRLRHHSGDYRWVLGRARPVRNDAGEIIRWFGTCTDINETKQAAEYVELLSQELSHRIKNIFAIIQSLVSLSRRRAPESAMFAQDLQARIAALGRAHDLARPHSDQSRPHREGVTLHSLAREILKPYLAMDDGRIRITGEDVSVDDAAATPFALILHELATNAKKYGALSVEQGQVHIFTSCKEETCSLIWTETGGPVVTGAPETSGFGTKLVSASAQSHLNGTIDRRWNAEGLVVTVTCPRTSLLRSAKQP